VALSHVAANTWLLGEAKGQYLSVAEMIQVGGNVIGEPTAYVVILGLVALDAFIPLIPAELVLISAALMASQGDLAIWLVFGAGVVGAMVGDSLVYALGISVGQPAADTVLRDERSRQRFRWARRKIRRHGEGLIVGSRFLPFGRTAATFAAGTLSFPWRRFLVADAVAASLSVGYLTSAGMLGGRVFSGNPWLALALSLGIVVVLVACTELVRRLVIRIPG
jgi:membrane-associated protein